MDTTYILLLLLLLYLFLEHRKEQQTSIRRILQHKHSKKERIHMQELAKQFIGKECLVYVMGSSSVVQGFLREVNESGLLVERDHSMQAVNLDYVIRIQEYPRKKNGKKKALIVD